MPQWNASLVSYLRAEEEMLELIAPGCDYPNAQGEDEGVSAKVVQTASDKHVAYVVCERTLPKSLEDKELLG